MKDENTKATGIACCPPLEPNSSCDVLSFHYRLKYPVRAEQIKYTTQVFVEVLVAVRIERCPGPLELGDLVYSTTLLPGEKVKLFSSDRRTRFTFDSSSQISYRNEQTHEEQFYMSSMNDFMTDLTSNENTHLSDKSHSSITGHGETSSLLGSIFSGPSVDVSGSHDANSTRDFLSELHMHAESSHHRVEQGTRASSSVSIGEVQTKTHAEGTSEDNFESASRQFENKNYCHAVTYFFYRINKTQTVKISIDMVKLRVIDPAVPGTRVTINQFPSNAGISIYPQSVLATDEKRTAFEAAAAARATSRVTSTESLLALQLQNTINPIPPDVRQRAIEFVKHDLEAQSILDKSGKLTPALQEEFQLVIQSSIPTPGIIVKGCLDECDTCEPARKREIDTDLENKKLMNEKLKREIDLMDKDWEHRCCPPSETEVE